MQDGSLLQYNLPGMFLCAFVIKAKQKLNACGNMTLLNVHLCEYY